MEHLRVPIGAVVPLVEIPYYAGASYDNQDFFGYPKRKGYQTINTGYLVPKQLDPAMLPFYQAWLYFGLLSAVLGLRGLPDALLRPSDIQHDALILDTTKLRPFIDAWLKRLYMSPRSQAEKMRVSADTHLRFTLCQCDFLEPYNTPNPESWMILIFSIKTLVDSLAPSCGITSRGEWSLQPLKMNFARPSASASTFPSATILTSHMQKNGWCPFRVNHLTSKYSYGVLYYLACLPKRRGQVRNHDSCMEAGACVADSVDPLKPFVCKHAMDCEPVNCQPRGVSLDRIISIIKQGEIPLVRCRCRGQEIELDVTVAKSNTKYTAITHVW